MKWESTCANQTVEVGRSHLASLAGWMVIHPGSGNQVDCSDLEGVMEQKAEGDAKEAVADDLVCY